MKRTDQERIERELKRREKKTAVTSRRVDGREATDATPGGYIKDLLDRLEFDNHQIYNTTGDDEVLELLLSMKEDLPEKQWDTVLRSAIRKTKVEQKDMAFNELKESLTSLA